MGSSVADLAVVGFSVHIFWLGGGRRLRRAKRQKVAKILVYRRVAQEGPVVLPRAPRVSGFHYTPCPTPRTGSRIESCIEFGLLLHRFCMWKSHSHNSSRVPCHTHVYGACMRTVCHVSDIEPRPKNWRQEPLIMDYRAFLKGMNIVPSHQGLCRMKNKWIFSINRGIIPYSCNAV